jgi:hypothetical protein
MYRECRKAGIFAVCAAMVLSISAFAQDGPREGGGFGPGMHAVRGSVATISGGTLTVKDEQGIVYTVATGPNTRLMKERQPIKVSDIHVGDMVAAGGEVNEQAKTVGAVFLAVMTPEQVQQYQKARAEFGKTWTAGTITAIQETNLSIKRPDNVVQVISVDENTSFRKHRESITLADIAVGDAVTSRGALKGEAFVATELNVGNPGQMGMFGGGGRGANAAGGHGPGRHHDSTNGAAASSPSTATPQTPPQNQ